MSDVDVIILDWNGGERLVRCIASVEAQTAPPARVIVFDNGSAPPSRNVLSHDLLHLRSETNLGFTGGMNEAMRAVEAPFVAWINNDVVLDPSWIARLRARFDADQRLAAVQSIIRSGNATIDGAGIDIATGRFLQSHSGEPLPASIDQPWGISGTAAMFRVASLRDVALGGDVLHPAFFAYYEDVELSARLRARGWRVELVPHALAQHAGSASASQLGRCREHLRTRNRYYVTRLHPGVGRLSALLLEDAKRAIRFALSGRLADAMTIVKGVVRGLTARLQGP